MFHTIIKLYNKLISQKYECKYDPNNHASVDIKYVINDEKSISIFVFESGAINITGANDCTQVVDAYNFIRRNMEDFSIFLLP